MQDSLRKTRIRLPGFWATNLRTESIVIILSFSCKFRETGQQDLSMHVSIQNKELKSEILSLDDLLLRTPKNLLPEVVSLHNQERQNSSLTVLPNVSYVHDFNQ